MSDTHDERNLNASPHSATALLTVQAMNLELMPMKKLQEATLKAVSCLLSHWQTTNCS
jgi:hypothetical protein